MPQDLESLAVILGVHVRTLQTWRKLPGSPESTDEGEWRRWMLETGHGSGPGAKAVKVDGVELPHTCSYDRAAAKGFPYSQARLREQVRAEELANQKAELELEQLRGRLLTIDEVRQRDEKWNQTADNGAQQVQHLLDALPAVNAELRKAFQDAYRHWYQSFREALAKAGR